MRVPVAPRREIGGVSHDSIGAPRNDVRDAWGDLQIATGAEIALHRLLCRNGLNVPRAISTCLGLLPAGDQTRQWVVFVA